jgi:hypothetical protein
MRACLVVSSAVVGRGNIQSVSERSPILNVGPKKHLEFLHCEPRSISIKRQGGSVRLGRLSVFQANGTPGTSTGGAAQPSGVSMSAMMLNQAYAPANQQLQPQGDLRSTVSDLEDPHRSMVGV